jgi:peptidoglycan/xylan/chitin deacetylase (PgdA/CDA1 family)
MSTAGDWEAFTDSLERWRRSGRRPVFWLRDDDAVLPGAALDRLLGMAGRFEVPVALAVIPAHAGTALARRVADERLATVVVHGWSHENHAFPGQKKQELGLQREAAAVIDEVAQALRRIEALFPGRSAPVLVPPWNRIDPALIHDVARIGYRALSVFGMPKPGPLPVINTTVDLIDWHGTRGSRRHTLVIGEIISQLDAALADPGLPPVGILTHHLVHDASAWTFLEALFEHTMRDGICRWETIGGLLEEYA